MLKLAVIYFTKSGEQTAKKLFELADTRFFVYDKQTGGGLKDFVKSAFSDMDGIVFISAAGIAVRLIAPYIKAKNIDPAVLVIDDLGQYVIPILSGHLGGANELAAVISKKIGATEIITTSTDIHKQFAVDIWSKEHGCVIANIDAIKSVSAAILRGEEVSFHSDFEVTGELPNRLTNIQSHEVGVAVSLDEGKKPYKITLNVIPKIITLGVGCKKNTASNLFEDTILQILKAQKISIKAVKSIASIDLKSEEDCILDFCKKYAIPPTFYTSEQLNRVKGGFTHSDFVKKTTGTDNVCERSAAYNDSKLLLKKQSQNGITAAISVENWECTF